LIDHTKLLNAADKDIGQNGKKERKVRKEKIKVPDSIPNLLD
jgi:hypothetical protein